MREGRQRAVLFSETKENKIVVILNLADCPAALEQFVHHPATVVRTVHDNGIGNNSFKTVKVLRKHTFASK